MFDQSFPPTTPLPSGGNNVWSVCPLLPTSSSWVPKGNVCHHGGLLVRSGSGEGTCVQTSAERRVKHVRVRI